MRGALKFLIAFLMVILTIGCTKYEAERCTSSGCALFKFIEVQPSKETTQICYQGKCEVVPDNRLLFKGGTEKEFCSNAPSLESDYVDNWWNAEGLIDECEMPVGANMQFIFKMHDQSVRNHTGSIQVKVYVINYDDDYKALQVFTAEDNNNDNLPDEWVHCGNVDKIDGKDRRIINCWGKNLKFIKLKNAAWNDGNLYIDLVEVLKV